MKELFAICVDNTEYPASLELHKTYRLLPDEEAERDGICASSTKAVRITSSQRTTSSLSTCQRKVLKC